MFYLRLAKSKIGEGSTRETKLRIRTASRTTLIVHYFGSRLALGILIILHLKPPLPPRREGG